ncbi:hypothetical protein M441DRAFT_113683, partial [Trichoderma asperellum CBS 433.97]
LFSKSPLTPFSFYDYSRPVWLRSAFIVYLFLHTSGTILAGFFSIFYNYHWGRNEP